AERRGRWRSARRSWGLALLRLPAAEKGDDLLLEFLFGAAREAGMVEGAPTLAVDGLEEGQRVPRVEAPEDLAVAVEQDRHAQLAVGDEAPDLGHGLGIVDVDRQDRQALLLVLVEEALQDGQLLLAGRAPGRPEAEEDHLPLVVRELHPLAVERAQRKVRRLGAGLLRAGGEGQCQGEDRDQPDEVAPKHVHRGRLAKMMLSINCSLPVPRTTLRIFMSSTRTRMDIGGEGGSVVKKGSSRKSGSSVTGNGSLYWFCHAWRSAKLAG